jgi:hypothetical protein
MAGLIEAAETLGVNVKHVARRIVLVADWRWERLERSKAAQTLGFADPRDVGEADAGDPGNLPHRSSLAAKAYDLRTSVSTDCMRRVRTGAAVGERFITLRAPDPFTAPAITHTGGLRRRAHRKA